MKSMKYNSSSLSCLAPALAIILLFASYGDTFARYKGHGGGSRSVHRSVNVHSHKSVRVNSYRHVDVDVHHHGYGGVGFGVGMFTGLVIGTAIASPPPVHTTVIVSGSSYMYADGVYYQPASSGYVVVGAPVGAIVATVPPGSVQVVMVATTYYYLNGAYYLQQGTAF